MGAERQMSPRALGRMMRIRFGSEGGTWEDRGCLHRWHPVVRITPPFWCECDYECVSC